MAIRSTGAAMTMIAASARTLGRSSSPPTQPFLSPPISLIRSMGGGKPEGGGRGRDALGAMPLHVHPLCPYPRKTQMIGKYTEIMVALLTEDWEIGWLGRNRIDTRAARA